MERGANNQVTAAALPEVRGLKQFVAQRQLSILAGSDLHGAFGGLEWFCAQALALRPDLIVFLGDFVTGGPLSFVRESLRDLRGLAPHCCVIPGNWDPREALPLMDAEAYDGLRHLHKHTAFLAGYSMLGLGGGATTPVGTTPLEMPDAALAAPFPALLPADIWLLHNPLYGFCDTVASGDHAGSPELARIYAEQVDRPLLVLSGHIHEARGTQVQAPTVFANPGALVNRQAAWITLVDDEVSVELLEG